MENLENAILDVLNDSEKMNEILAIAQNLGLGGESSLPQQEDLQMAGTVMGILQDMQKSDPRQENLLHALLPYLDATRQKKLKRAMQIGKLSRLAGAALQYEKDTT
jgi:hypothetical protein